jgi:hypothetical protein
MKQILIHLSKNEVEIKRLQTTYTSKKNVVTQLNSASDKFASSTDAITAALAKKLLQFHLLDKTTHTYYH